MAQLLGNYRNCFFDVDDTLVFKDIDPRKPLPVVEINGRTFQVHDKHVQKIIDYKVMGFTIFVWSTSGQDWAKKVIEALGIGQHVDYYMSKPHRVFDDCKNLGDTIKHGYIPV